LFQYIDPPSKVQTIIHDAFQRRAFVRRRRRKQKKYNLWIQTLWMIRINHVTNREELERERETRSLFEGWRSHHEKNVKSYATFKPCKML
jgi:hypothetical protein